MSFDTINEKYDVLVVGAGLSGAVIAERLATQYGFKVLVVEKRDHIAGNCYDFIDENQILINKYGAHIFHTNDEEVWKYVNQFGEWQIWEHRVLASVDGKLVNIPVNINTVNAICGTNIRDEREMEDWLKKVQVKYEKIRNSEEVARSRVGNELYEKLFKNYSFKQWNKYPEELDPSVLSRIPVRSNFNDKYFDDKYQALPVKGYTNLVNNILMHQNITVILNTDYFECNLKFDHLVFTGQIDRYFQNSGLEKLEYRSIDFIVERYKNKKYYQQNSVINFPDLSVPYTRVVEYKHFLNKELPHTTIVKEVTKDNGEPYYPVQSERNIGLYEKYRELAKQQKNVHFVGRLANYKYFNMDEAIKNALHFCNTFSK